MKRFNRLFEQVALEKRAAKIPFLMLGYPTIEANLNIIDNLIKGGADALELGIPFSDPIADGPIIQKAASQARLQGVTPHDCFNIINEIRQKYPSVPIGLLVYANLVYHQGIDTFYAKAAQVGIDAVLIPDLPTQEAVPFCEKAKAHKIAPVLLATQTCSDADLALLAKLSEGFTYVVTRKGVTGIDKQSEFENANRIVDKLKHFCAPPPVFGFGIKNGHDVKMAYLHQAQGAIIGSALIDALSKMPIELLNQGAEVKKLMESLFTDNIN